MSKPSALRPIDIAALKAVQDSPGSTFVQIRDTLQKRVDVKGGAVWQPLRRLEIRGLVVNRKGLWE